MCNEYIGSQKNRLRSMLFTSVLLLSPSFLTHAEQNISVNQARINPVNLTANKQQASRAYQTILNKTQKEYLWLKEGKLTLSGLSLHWLLADLGWHDLPDINALAKARYRQYDRLLTNGLLALIKRQGEEGESRVVAAIRNDLSDQLLASLVPQYDQITQLRQVIAHYRMLSRYPWPVLDDHFKPMLGQSHPQVQKLRVILQRLGDMPKKRQSKSRADIFDSVVLAALKKFQYRHGLTADGKLGAKTYAALQVTPKQRVQQLQVNLWRWFSLPYHAPEKYLLVNIPGYQLAVIEDGQQVLQMKVIVGDKDNPTPQMVSQIDRLTLNPTWTPTVNITQNELIPQYQKDYLSLKRQSFQLIKGSKNNQQRKEIDQPGLNLDKLLQSYRLVQAPGDDNALGYYRFNIPNNHFIYLHDTPVKSLFKRAQRALSHGCVRLEDAGLLAKYLLSFEGDYTEQDLFTALKSKKTNDLTIAQPLPVYITYQTAWLNKHGKIHFSADIYSLDQQNVTLTQSQTIVSNSVITYSQNSL